MVLALWNTSLGFKYHITTISFILEGSLPHPFLYTSCAGIGLKLTLSTLANLAGNETPPVLLKALESRRKELDYQSKYGALLYFFQKNLLIYFSSEYLILNYLVSYCLHLRAFKTCLLSFSLWVIWDIRCWLFCPAPFYELSKMRIVPQHFPCHSTNRIAVCMPCKVYYDSDLICPCFFCCANLVLPQKLYIWQQYSRVLTHLRGFQAHQWLLLLLWT